MKPKSDGFPWELGRTVLHEMINTEFGEKRANMNLLRLITVFQGQFTRTRIIYHSGGDLFWAKRKQKETHGQHWRKLGELQKDCELRNITLNV